MHRKREYSVRTLAAALVLISAFVAVANRPTSARATLSSNISPASADIQRTSDTQPAPQGIKSWLVKRAVELLAEAIRRSSRIMDLLIEQLDAKAAKAFRKHAKDIADALDDIAKIPDLAVGIVRDKLRYFLTNQLAMNPGTAGVIVEGVTYILGLLL